MKIIIDNLKSDIKSQLKDVNLNCETCGALMSPGLEADLIPDKNGNLKLIVVINDDIPNICPSCN